MLPPRLGDPLRFAWLALLINVVFLLPIALLEPNLALPLFFLPPLLFILPLRRTNSFYLRSFAGDERSGRLKLCIKKGLGWSFRLSGVRAPQKRTSTFLKYATYLSFCFKYSTIKHMSLEADAYWLVRLWRSLADARCAFVDLLDPTPQVAVELELVYRCLGSRRVACIGDISKNEDQWRSIVVQQLNLGLEEARNIRILIWNKELGRKDHSFIKAVRDFARALPNGRAGLSDAGLDTVRKHAQIPEQWFWLRLRHFGAALAGLMAIPLGLAMATVGTALVVYMVASTRAGGQEVLGVEEALGATQAGMLIGLIGGLLGTGLIIFGWLCVSLWIYFRESGRILDRIKAIICVLYYLEVFSLLAFATGLPDILYGLFGV